MRRLSGGRGEWPRERRQGGVSVYRGFPATLVNTIRCPTDGGQVDSDTEDHVIERGSLVCRRCGRVLHVEDGVVNLLQVQAPIDTTASREVGARDREAS